jgi:glycosyltransferase involved in cell wall biosynthesis
MLQMLQMLRRPALPPDLPARRADAYQCPPTVPAEPARSEAPTVAFVIPCFNEAEVLFDTLEKLCRHIGQLVGRGRISDESYVVWVDDGSRDQTWQLIEKACAARPGRVRGLKLARNVGHQVALFAGLTAQCGKADAVVTLDADLQDDISVVDQMVARFAEQGAEIVFAVRGRRETDTTFKRTTAQGYYRTLRSLGVDVIPDHADFRLMSDRAVRALAEFGEVNLFLRGLVMQLGFKTDTVTFDRLPRLYGETKYNLRKMAALALDGVTSFSIRPLRIIAMLGLVMLLFSVGAIAWVFAAWVAGATIEGWTSLMLVFLLISSFQTLALGIIGEYVGKTYFEAKARPRFIVEKEVSA